ncbi:hypothetical protein MMAS_40200 [Mycobacteroides abscessus subsp. massiliense CCUG 48898 = JCM 15300]|nr:hypothetical protein MMAS_40200 [Mycobacteroides abscessus subsp. massiliense CCUG 48898 = JCM 15300]
MTSQHERAVAFAALHQSGTFVVPNPWDAGTARILTAYGFPALATTSAGLAFALGRRDGANLIGQAETLANAAQIAAATHLPVSADLENGGPAIGDIVMTIREAAASGLVGGSIEDATGRPDAPIFPLAEAVDRITAAAHTTRDLPFPFTLTARAENFLYGRPDLTDTITRLNAYAEAGADVVYAPGLPDAEAVRTVCAAVDRPVNLLATGFVLNHSVGQIAEWGGAANQSGLRDGTRGAGGICRGRTRAGAAGHLWIRDARTLLWGCECALPTRLAGRGNQAHDAVAHLPEVDDPEDAAARYELASGPSADTATTTFGPRSGPLCPEDVLGHGDLFFPAGFGGVADSAVSRPGGRLELQTAVEAVSGICRPVSAGLTFGNSIPIHGVGGRDTRGHGQRHHEQHREDQTHRTPVAHPPCPVHDDLHVTAPRSSIPRRGRAVRHEPPATPVVIRL